jgi:hypothetical protein
MCHVPHRSGNVLNLSKAALFLLDRSNDISAFRQVPMSRSRQNNSLDHLGEFLLKRVVPYHEDCLCKLPKTRVEFCSTSYM